MICSMCSAEWECCAPGTEAEERAQGNLLVLNPAPEVPIQIWCLNHAPWAQKRLKPKDLTKCTKSK
jgi:hypothetical protein